MSINDLFSQNVLEIYFLIVYVIELTLKQSPFPLTVQRKKLADAQTIYRQVRDCMQRQRPELLELNCEKIENKQMSILVSEILAVQIYEKTASMVGSKRPGFTIDN